MTRLRIIFWRSYYAIINPFLRIYYKIFHPKTRGVKCLIKNGDTFLLVRLAYAHKQWVFPGGGVDKHESYESAAWRELKEETAVKPQSLSFFGQYESTGEYKRDTVQCFYGETDSIIIRFDPLEIAEAKWSPRENFPLDCSGSVSKIMALYDN